MPRMGGIDTSFVEPEERAVENPGKKCLENLLELGLNNRIEDRHNRFHTPVKVAPHPVR